MANRILFAGGRLDSLEEVTAGGSESNTTTGRDTAYTDALINYPTQTNASHRATFRDENMAVVSVASGTVWGHCEIALTTSYTANRGLLEFYDSAGVLWYAIRSASTTTLGLYYNSGTAGSPVWTLLGDPWSHPSGARVAYDVSLTFGPPHTATVYYGNTQIATGSFSQPLLTNVQSMVTRGIATTTGANYYTRCSQYLCTENISTVGAKVAYVRATGAGSNSEWTGAVTDVNEAVNSDTTVNTAATAGLTQTYAMGDITVPAGYVVKSVWQWLRAKNDGASPLNLKSVLRLGGSNLVGAANMPGIGLGFSIVGARYDTNPATGLAWTQAEWNAAEAGFQSAA